MLRSMLEYVKLSASSVAGRVVGGTIVVVPFLLAGVFALAAIYMVLRDSYGDIAAAVILAVVFALTGLIVAIVVNARMRQQQDRLDELRAQAGQSAATAALLAINPALILGAGRVAFGLFRRAPLLTTVTPLAVGFLLAMASAQQRRRARESAVSRVPRRDGVRAGNSRDLTH